MPFNLSGLLVRLFRWTDDRDAGTKILAERMDQEFDNVFSGVNSILNGEQAFLGPVTVPFGTAADPGINLDAGMGLYRKDATTLAVAVGGTEEVTISDGRMQIMAGTTLQDVIHKGHADYVAPTHNHDARYLQNSGNQTLSGRLAISGGGTTTAPALVLSGFGASEDGISWVTADGAYFIENNVTVGHIPSGSTIPHSYSLLKRSVADGRYATAGHNHDNRYFTESEADSRFAYKSHTHPYVSNTGDTINGSLTVTGDTIVQSGRVMHSNRTTGQIGCVLFGRSASPHTLAYGDTMSGSNLKPSDHTGHTNAGTLSGTWKCLGYCMPGNATMFVRIA